MDADPGRVARIREQIAQEINGSSQQSDTVAWLRGLCVSAVRMLPASGAGVSLLSDNGARGVAASSDGASAVLEELQFTLGEGPCMSAFADRRPVLEPGLDSAPAARWPAYWPAVLARGVRAVFAFPLQVGAARLGVMDVYRDQPGPLPRDSVTMALAYAEIAVDALLDGQQQAPAGNAAAGLDKALAYRHEVYQAQGMAMVQLGVPLDQAMAIMRAYAYAHDRPLVDVARDVVAGRLTLEHR